MDYLEYIILFALLLLIILCVAILKSVKRSGSRAGQENISGDIIGRIDEDFDDYSRLSEEKFKRYSASIDAMSRSMINTLQLSSNNNETKLDILTRTLNDNFKALRSENAAQIDKIRDSVNERLDKTINAQFEKSFKSVIEQMSKLQTTMGELKGISTQVGSLEKTLNGIKTRGIIGEAQLRQIIMDSLTPEQYDIEVATVPGSSEHVEVAVKLPSREGPGQDSFFYLPIDSKCHIDRYEALLDAYDSGNKDMILKARRDFSETLKKDAYNIADKYVRPPFTAPYGILFVPFEGMYSEIVNLNLLDYFNGLHITIAGPYTLMAILSTVSNYWQAFAIEKKTNEIELTLSRVKSEFSKFDAQIVSIKKNIDSAGRKLDNLQTTRTNAILRALKDVTSLEIEEQSGTDYDSDEFFDED